MRTRRLIWATAAAIASLVTGISGSAMAAAPASGLNCDSSFNPYDYSQAQVSACGYKTFARSDIAALPGGGYRYDYSMNGTKVQILVPPKGFNPSAASAAQLNEYGFPARPARAAATAQWQEQMGTWKGTVAPPPFLAESHTRADNVYFTNWSGYLLTGNHSDFTQAEAWYAEPTFGGSVCASNEEVTWAGIGGKAKGDYLGQNGTAHNVPGGQDHEAWWEIVPGYYITWINFFATPGYIFDASTRWTGNGYRFYFYNYYNQTTFALDVVSTTYSGDSAEAIAERPMMSNGTLANLSNFGTLTFYYSEANGKGFDTYPATSVRHGVHMIDDSGNDMADPSNVGSDGFFTDTQKSCQ